MDINRRSRTELKSYFVKNAIPTESNFAELIDAGLNQKDDGIAKPPGNPLCIEAAGDDTSQKKTLNFYLNLTDEKPSWVLSLNPRSDPGNPETARLGFNIGDGEGDSRFFIDRSTGNIGIGTTNPGSYKLSIGKTGGQNAFHLASDFGLRGDNRLNLIKFGNDGDYQILHKSSGAFGRNTLAMHVNQNDAFGVYSTGWRPLIEVKAGSGDLYVRGNLGIGTTQPGAQLHLYKHPSSPQLRIEDHKGYWQFWGGYNLHIREGGTTDRLFIQGKTGNVGINTDKPSYSLQVDGEVFARDGVLVVGNRNTHLDTDGAFYRYRGQVYITVDDNLYVKDSGGGIKFHFDTNAGLIRQETWKALPLINSWVNYSSQYNPAGYFKDSMGIVHLRGVIKNGAASHICTLPAGYRPPRRELHGATTNPNAHARVDVLRDGRVFGVKYDKGWLSLDGLTFRAA